MMKRNRLPETISIFAIGLAVGTALGVLFAPRSGEDTREFLAGTARDQFDTAVARGKEWARTAQDTVDNVKESIREAADEGGRAFDQARRA
jgi:gas vesicle protein